MKLKALLLAGVMTLLLTCVAQAGGVNLGNLRPFVIAILDSLGITVAGVYTPPSTGADLSGTVSTVNSDVTTIITFSPDPSSAYTVDVAAVARRSTVDGGQAAAFRLSCTLVSRVGAGVPTLVDNLDLIYLTRVGPTTTDPLTVFLEVSGTDVKVQVTGELATAYSWSAELNHLGIVE